MLFWNKGFSTRKVAIITFKKGEKPIFMFLYVSLPWVGGGWVKVMTGSILVKHMPTLTTFTLGSVLSLNNF
jgi:hypothetical protein